MNLKTSTTKTLNTIGIILMILGTIIFLFFLRWLGLKGCLGIVVGMFLMALLLLSKNKYLKWIIDLTKSENYIWELMKK